MEKIRRCPYSGEVFKPKRSNQKFASKKNRVNFYNQQYREKRLPLERINQRLFHNYSILEQELQKNTKAILSNDFLAGKGYDFNYFTQLLDNGSYPTFGIYDITITILNNNEYQIQKNETNTYI